MRILVVWAALLFMAVGCATGERVSEQKITDMDADKEYFSTALAESLKPGTATREDVVKKLGAPFVTDRSKDGGERYIYMQTLKRQAIYTFNGGTLSGFEWSGEYSHPTLPRDGKR